VAAHLSNSATPIQYVLMALSSPPYILRNRSANKSPLYSKQPNNMAHNLTLINMSPNHHNDTKSNDAGINNSSPLILEEEEEDYSMASPSPALANNDHSAFSHCSHSDYIHRKLFHAYSTRYYYPILGFLILLFTVKFVLDERTSMTSKNDTILSDSAIYKLSNKSISEQVLTHRLDISDFPIGLPSAPSENIRTRLIFIVIDGMRFDAIFNNPELNSLLTQPNFAQNSAIYKLNTQLPTISIPNWITLLSGVSPAFHGRSGNDDVSEVPFDNIFQQAALYKLRTGLTGDATWKSLFESSIQPLNGDGSINVERYEAFDANNDRGHSYTYRDNKWAQILYQAMKSPNVYNYSRFNDNFMALDSSSVLLDVSYFAFDFFFSYFVDIDGQGHAFGANSANYQAAITEKTLIIKNFLNILQSIDSQDSRWRSIVVITSDHGHVSVGGHGGSAAVLKEIPLIVYANHSNLGLVEDNADVTKHRIDLSQSPDASANEEIAGSSTDIAATLSALLGIPAPKHSEGIYLSFVNYLLANPQRQALYEADLIAQKQQFLEEFLAEMDLAADYPQINSINNSKELQAIFESTQAQVLQGRIIRNFFVSLVMLLGFILLLTLIAHHYSYLDILALLPDKIVILLRKFMSLCLFLYWHIRRKLFRNESTRPQSYLHCQIRSSVSKRIHRALNLFALMLVCLYVVLVIGIFLTIYRVGYRYHSQWRWDFTLFNSPRDAYILLTFALTPGILICFCTNIIVVLLVNRSKLIRSKMKRYFTLNERATAQNSQDASATDTELSEVNSPSYNALNAEILAIRNRTHSTNKIQSNPEFFSGLLLLFYHYLLFNSLLLALFLLFSQFYHCAFNPYWLPVQFLTNNIWTSRFQSLTVAFMFLPLITYSLIGLVIYCAYLYSKVFIVERRHRNQSTATRRSLIDSDVSSLKLRDNAVEGIFIFLISLHFPKYLQSSETYPSNHSNILDGETSISPNV
jgi:hypothetical protein